MAQPSGQGAPGEVPPVPATLPEPFAVLPFENRSGVSGLDWMSVAVPFVVAEKAEGHRRLRPAYGPLVVPEKRAPAAPEAGEVARFGREVGARWVFTGWIRRPDWQLQLAVQLWRLDGERATRVGEVVSRGDFKEVHDMIAKAIVELCATASMPVAEADLPAVEVVPTADFYAFTLFGRGLSAFLGSAGPPDVERSRKALERTVFIDPRLAEAQRILAELYLRDGLEAKARGRIEQALRFRPRYYPALIASALIERARGQGESAREILSRALSARPWDLEARYRLGQVLWEIGRADESFRELKRVVEHREDDVRVHRILVMIHAARGDGPDLVRELEAVVRLDPDDERTRLDLGAAYASVGREQDAITTYQSIAGRNPRQVQALKFLGDLFKRQGKLPHAIKYYGQALEARPEDPRAYFLLGAVYVEAGNDQEAKRVYRRAQRFKRYLPEVYNNLGAIAFREGNLGESLWYLRRAVAQRQDRVRYRYNFALSLSASTQTDEALTQIEAGLKLDPDYVELHYLHGVVLLRTGAATEARGSFERTLALEPGHEGALHNLALLEELERRAREGEIVAP